MTTKDNLRIDGLIRVATKIAAERTAIQRKIKQSILDDDLRTALLVDCELVNFPRTRAILDMEE